MNSQRDFDIGLIMDVINKRYIQANIHLKKENINGIDILRRISLIIGDQINKFINIKKIKYNDGMEHIESYFSEGYFFNKDELYKLINDIMNMRKITPEFLNHPEIIK